MAYSETNTSTVRMRTYLIDNGVVSTIQAGAINGDCTVSGTTLTITNTNSSFYALYQITEVSF